MAGGNFTRSEAACEFLTAKAHEGIWPLLARSRIPPATQATLSSNVLLHWGGDTRKM